MVDQGDFAMPNMGDDRVTFVPNSLFVADKPVLILLDEIGKANRAVMNAALPLMLEQRVATTYLPEGSIVMGATNLASDGVGDVFPPHAKNRVTFVTMMKPDADIWTEWAINNGVEAEVTTWVQENPHCLASYTDFSADDKSTDNPYIFYPNKSQAAFVSPRSLARASNLVRNRANMSERALIAGLAGTIGEAAARDMQAFITIADDLPRWPEIMKNPTKVSVPDNPIACVILAMSAVMKVDKTTVDPWVEYMTRLPLEIQCLFATQAMRSRTVAQFVARNKSFTDWARENSWVA